MRIFNPLDKTEYIVALALLLAFSVFILSIHVGETFVRPVKPDFPVKSNAYFGYENISTDFISSARTGIFGRYEEVKGLKPRYRAVRQSKVLPVSKFILEKHINNVYAIVRLPHYMEVYKLLAQLIIIYIFLTDGKKRSLKLSCN